ncbi:MAG: NADPH-dependent 7-cyano-7-deazaguanine reductase QueF [Elusimicrobia bacterium]|nr:NADPH-dependent 7-cyano-7-deazaguanine reductase QueF [Elusimicrobiota bacterium]
MKPTTKQFPEFSKVSKQLLQAMPYQYIGNDINVCIQTEEFTCLCPWTGLPDFADLTIKYIPSKVVVELKSLKMYLQSYRMVGMVHESVVNSIMKDLKTLLKPKKIYVELKFKIRGGITTTVSAGKI